MFVIFFKVPIVLLCIFFHCSFLDQRKHNFHPFAYPQKVLVALNILSNMGEKPCLARCVFLELITSFLLWGPKLVVRSSLLSLDLLIFHEAVSLCQSVSGIFFIFVIPLIIWFHHSRKMSSSARRSMQLHPKTFKSHEIS